MFKLIILGVIGFIVYKVFFQERVEDRDIEPYSNFDDENDLIECSICHTYVPKNECKFTQNGCICKDCQK